MDNRVKNVEDRVYNLETEIKDVKKAQNEIEKNQAETRVYVKQIFDRIEDLKLLIQSNPKKTFSANKEWIDLVKWIIGGTIFIIIAALFSNGGL